MSLVIVSVDKQVMDYFKSVQMVIHWLTQFSAVYLHWRIRSNHLVFAIIKCEYLQSDCHFKDGISYYFDFFFGKRFFEVLGTGDEVFKNPYSFLNNITYFCLSKMLNIGIRETQTRYLSFPWVSSGRTPDRGRTF